MSFIFEELVQQDFLRLIISGIVAFAFTYVAIPVIRNVNHERKLSDSPIKRSSHSEPVATFGGVGIFAGTFIGYLLWNFEDEGILMHKVLACSVLLFFLGIKDDIYALDASKKLLMQVLCALVVAIGSDLRISTFFGIFGIEQLPYIVSVLFSVFLIVSIVNAFNLIDGIDGLSAGIGMIASAGFGLWFFINNHLSLACLGLSLSASLLGFIRFNFSKTSKIFMGDTGSLIVGFLVAVMALKFVEANVDNKNPSSVYMNAPVIAIALLSVPIFDTLRVFGVRISRGRSPFSADRLHTHHLLVDLGLEHKTVSILMYAFTVVFTLSIYFSRHYFTNTQLALIILGVFVLYLILGYYLEIKRYRWKKSKRTERKEEECLPTQVENVN